jgi:hypothetical protein
MLGLIGEGTGIAAKVLKSMGRGSRHHARDICFFPTCATLYTKCIFCIFAPRRRQLARRNPTAV